MEEQIRRIERMEEILQGAKPVLAKLEEALDAFAALREPLAALDAYYGSREWLQDLDDDALGKLPPELKRGVLSQDEVYDLLTDARRLERRMAALAAGEPEPEE